MARRNCTVTVDIAASPVAVWKLISDVERWPTWTPTMTSVRVRSGQGLSVGSTYEVKQPGLARSLFKVDRCDGASSFCWSARSAGVHTMADHVITERPGGGSRLTLMLTMEGPLAPVVWLVAGRKVRRFVDTEAASAKAAVETAAS